MLAYYPISFVQVSLPVHDMSPGHILGIIDGIFQSVHAIRFAREWDAMTAKLQVGKKWKGKFRKNAFEVIWPGKTSDYEKEYKHFRTRHEKVIAGRNSLLKMYLIRSIWRCCFFWIPYGPQ